MGTNYNTMNAYDADCRIPEFKGLMQYGDSLHDDPRFATEAWNMETIGGVLQPASACLLLAPVLDRPIETIARLHRRFHDNPLERDMIIGASDGKLYWMLPDDEEWNEIDMPDGVESFKSNKWSWVTYEINPVGSSASVDVLLISNAEDGMFMVNGETMAVTAVDTKGKKFGVIERYAERIWGGAIADNPDMLMYSAPYDPTDWSENPTIPEDGAGDIQQPSWDGDSFVALKAFGSQLIAFKRNRVWRIVGTDPGEYTFKEQFGGGAVAPNAIVTESEYINIFGYDGFQVYDGLTVSPYQQNYCREEWKQLRSRSIGRACAVSWKNKLYLAYPGDDCIHNNRVMVYDRVDGTWTMRRDLAVESWLVTEDGLFFTSAVAPGCMYQYQENSWETGHVTAASTKWVTPWNDLYAKQTIKGSFEMYLQLEVKDTPAKVKISIQTEKKTKTKEVTFPVVTKPGKLTKQKRVHFGGTGRRFRIIIETDGGANAPCWRIVGGILTVAEVDSD